MRKKLVASFGIAGLLLLSLPNVAAAATDTITDIPAEPIGVDDSAIARQLTVSTAGDITDVTVMVDFLAHDGEECSAPIGTAGSWSDELALQLESPAGTMVNLVYPYSAGSDLTYPNWWAQAQRVQVTFSDAADVVVGASNDGAPETGTFRPVEPLSAFHGEAAAGEWLCTSRTRTCLT